MKNFQILCLLLIALSTPKWAHGQPAQCSAIYYTDMTSRSYAGWNWETPRDAPNDGYCKTWAIRREGSANPNYGVVTGGGAPWEQANSSNSSIMQRIAIDKDYTRAKGWEVLKMNLGAGSEIKVPYFFLYNRYTSMVRTYFWMDNSTGTYANGALITLTNDAVNANRSTGILSLNNPLITAPDQYLQRTDLSDDLVSYVAKVPAQSGWIVAEFTMAYDPNSRNSRYLGNTLEVAVHAIVDSQLTLDGTFNFKTDAQEGFAFGGSKTEVATNTSTQIKEFAATAQKGAKFLGSIKPDDVDKFITYFNDRAVTQANKATSGFETSSLQTLTSIVAGNNKLGSTLSKLFKAAGSAAPFLGLIGPIIGYLSGSDDTSAPQAPPFTPTVSNGSIALKGKITTKYPIATVLMQVPGTSHNATGATQPYYDCPLGVFNLAQTPTLNSMGWNVQSGYVTYCVSGNGGGYATFENYTNYQVKDDLIAAVNRASGLKMISAQAALVVKAPYLFNPSKIGNGCNTEQYTDHLRAEFSSGAFEVARNLPGEPVQYQTHFVDFSCFKGASIYAHNGAAVFIRVKVELQREGASIDAPIMYYVQDYAVNSVPTTTATNPAYTSGGSQPPFSSSNSFLQRSNTVGSTTWNGKAYTYVFSGTYTTPSIVYEPNAPLVAPNPNNSSDKVIINHPNNPGTTKYYSSNEITLRTGFSVTPGTNFSAVPGSLPQNFCGPTVVLISSDPCTPSNTTYNPIAYRNQNALSSAVEKRQGQLKVFPNPTTGTVTIESDNSIVKEVVVYDVHGSKIVSKYPQQRAKNGYSIDLQGIKAGIYLLRVITDKGTFSQKVILQ